MKNKITFTLSIFSAFLFSLLISTSLSAQWNPTGANTGQTIFRTGNVGIGHSSASTVTQRLDVNGAIKTNSDLIIHGNIKGQANNGGAAFEILAGSSHDDGAYILFPGAINSGMILDGFNGTMQLRTDKTFFTLLEGNGIAIRNGGGSFDYQDQWGQSLFNINPWGATRIGFSAAPPPAGYMLSVESGIITQQVKVCPDAASWCDYVFEENYELNPTDFVEKHIKEHKHLPNVPSAKEVGEEGINLGEMDATLLRQIEELWMHVIEMKKENKALLEEINKLKSGKE